MNSTWTLPMNTRIGQKATIDESGFVMDDDQRDVRELHRGENNGRSGSIVFVTADQHRKHLLFITDEYRERGILPGR